MRTGLGPFIMLRWATPTIDLCTRIVSSICHAISTQAPSMRFTGSRVVWPISRVSLIITDGRGIPVDYIYIFIRTVPAWVCIIDIFLLSHNPIFHYKG